MLHNGKVTQFLPKIVFLSWKNLSLPSKSPIMKRSMQVISVLLVLVLLFGSCASSRQSRAMRKAERQMERNEKQSERQYDKAKDAHFKRQARKTKRMMRRDQRRAERMRRKQRSSPFFQPKLYINKVLGKKSCCN